MRIIRRAVCVGFAYGLVVGCIQLSTAPSLHAQANLGLSSWKLNLAKSKYDPGPPPMSETRTYEPFGTGGVKATFNRVDGTGKKLTISYSGLFDGKDYKYTGSPESDAISLKRIDANSFEATQKLNSKVSLISVNALSADGKVRTVTTTRTDAQGKKHVTVAVFDKQ
jgi:hypothetical protein